MDLLNMANRSLIHEFYIYIYIDLEGIFIFKVTEKFLSHEHL